MGDPHIDWTSFFIIGAWWGFVVGTVCYFVFFRN